MSYRHELIEAKKSEGIYGLLLAIAFITFALDSEGLWVAFDLILGALFIAFGIKDLRRARQVRKEA